MKCNCGKGGECNCGGTKMKMPKTKMAYGGMAKKKMGYSYGGSVKKPMKMNRGGMCGASNPASKPMASK